MLEALCPNLPLIANMICSQVSKLYSNQKDLHQMDEITVGAYAYSEAIGRSDT